MKSLNLYYQTEAENDLFLDSDEDNFFLHKTKDGRTMLVAEMDDSHLINTINYIILRMDDAKKMLSFDNNDFASIVMKRKINTDAVKERVHALYIIIHRYIVEAIMRRLEIEEQLDLLRELLKYNKGGDDVS